MAFHCSHGFLEITTIKNKRSRLWLCFIYLKISNGKIMKKAILSLIATTTLLFIASTNVHAAQEYKDGTFIGKGQGKEGEVEVSVKINGGKIAEMEVVKHEDTDAMMQGVIDNILPEIVEKQTVEGIDAVTGATMSSKGVLEASKKALDQAKP